MQMAHKICLLQCPDASCLKSFKDEWKLKKHLLSNKSHHAAITYNSLHDIMSLHVEVTQKKFGFSCPFCKIDYTSKNMITDTVNNNLKGDNDTNNYLYFNSYSDLESHFISSHESVSIKTYCICKHCGHVFQSRYKLSSHIFNVHSGKKKSKKTLAIKKSEMSSEVNEHMSRVIDSVVNGSNSLVSDFECL